MTNRVKPNLMKENAMKRISLIVLCVCMCVCYACDQKQITKLKIMSYNIRHGEGMDNVLDLSRAAEIIKEQAPDLCGLQEVDNSCLRTNKIEQSSYLAEKTNMTGTFGKFMDFDGGEYGMATLSAKPIISTKRLQLPDGIAEPRSAIIHEVQIAKACTIVFVNVHFDWVESDEGVSSRLNQAKTLTQYLNTMDKAVIITGDFNCSPGSTTMNYFNEQGFEFVNKGDDNLSFQGESKAELDHVVFRNTNDVKMKAISIDLLEEPVVSDHRPLVAELEVEY